MNLRRTPLRSVPPADHRSEPGYREWKATVYGHCSVCGEGRQRLERHHVIAEQRVRQIDPSRVWDLANSLLLGAHCRCHSRHTNAAQRLPVSILSAEQIEFAIELLEAGPADVYFDTYYAPV